MRPGITGLAQVSGRNAITWDEKFAKDVEYVDRRSLRLDAVDLWRGRWRRCCAATGSPPTASATMPEFMGRAAWLRPWWSSAPAASDARPSTWSTPSTRDASEPVWDVVGVVDDAPSRVNLRAARRAAAIALPGRPWTTSWLGPARLRYVVGIGAPRARATIADRLDWRRAARSHARPPRAPRVGSDVQIGAGTVVCAGARLTTNIALGGTCTSTPT